MAQLSTLGDFARFMKTRRRILKAAMTGAVVGFALQVVWWIYVIIGIERFGLFSDHHSSIGEFLLAIVFWPGALFTLLFAGGEPSWLENEMLLTWFIYSLIAMVGWSLLATIFMSAFIAVSSWLKRVIQNDKPVA